MENEKLKSIIEAALLAAGGPLSLDHMLQLFDEEAMPEKKELREVLEQLTQDYEGRGVQIAEVGNGWRIQVRAEYAPWVSRLWEEKPGRYSRALMETLALIAYRQPITRGEIEDVRGVSVSSNIIKTLQEREWIRVVGHRDVPGKPALYATTKTFLDYFSLKGLDDLPTLAEIRDLDSINQELALSDPDRQEGEASAGESEADVSAEISDEAQQVDADVVDNTAAGEEGPVAVDEVIQADVMEADDSEEEALAAEVDDSEKPVND
jgi:segregation and condensation protein B